MVEDLVITGFGMGAALAQNLAVYFDLPVIVDPFAALSAGDAGRFVAGEFAGVHGDVDPLLGKEVCVGEFAVGKHLLPVLVFDLRIEVAGTLFGGFKGSDADGLIGGKIEEGSGHLAPVAELEGALAETAAGDDPNSIGGAAVDLDEGDEALAVGPFWVVDAEALATQHRHADSKNLSGAEMAVGYFGFAKEGFKRLHGVMIGGGTKISKEQPLHTAA